MNTYRKTILYVDDDVDDIAMLRYAIETVDSGHQIIEATDGLHALNLLNQLHEKNELPCLIVLDINMPRMDGKETLAALQVDRKLASIPVVLFSTSSSIGDKSFSKEKNGELITKPFDFKSLYITANKILCYCRA